MPAALAEPLSDALLEAGAQAVTVEDAQAGTALEQPVFGEPGSPAAGGWADNRLQVLVAGEADPAALVAQAAQACGLAEPPPFTLEMVPAEDWVRRTQSQFEPVRIAQGLWIVPSWHAPVDPAAINIRLDPGLAFGTGTHPTTQLCLRWLLGQARPGLSVLDYGCGSGILAIAAARLGAAPVWGLDIDPDAVAAARANAAHNGVAVHFVDAQAQLARPYDLVLANILANPLRLLAPALAACVRPGGRIALAGLLESQAEMLSSLYAVDFQMRTFGVQEGWACLEGVRR